MKARNKPTDRFSQRPPKIPKAAKVQRTIRLLVSLTPISIQNGSMDELDKILVSLDENEMVKRKREK